MAVKPIPDGHNVITPILLVENADALMTFLKRVFGAEEYQITRRPDGKIYHADLTIAGAHIMVGEAGGPFAAAGAAVNVYVPDIDAAYARAVDAGATSVMPPGDRFYGDRVCAVRDPCGITWSIATHIEDVAPDELKRREAEMLRQMAAGPAAPKPEAKAGATSGHE